MSPLPQFQTVVLESCNSTWLFDTEHLRFRRILKGLDMDAQHAATAWRPYFGLELDPMSESFVVLLNPEGTRLLRSWRHVEHCPQCGGEATAELHRRVAQRRFRIGIDEVVVRRLADALRYARGSARP